MFSIGSCSKPFVPLSTALILLDTLLWCAIAQPAGASLATNSNAIVRYTDLAVPKSGHTGFALVPTLITGLRFTNTLDEWSGAANRVLYNGSGLAAGDFDADGLPDLFLCNLNGTNALYKNLGSWRFQNVTRQAGLSTPLPYTRGATFSDLNGDGWLDLLLSVTGRGVLCFRNTSQGNFIDVTPTTGIPAATGATTFALADIDGNGTLDLYVVQYRPDDIRDRGQARMTIVKGRPVLPGTDPNRFVFRQNRLEECGQPDYLLLNDGTGRFKPLSWTQGAFLDETGRPLTAPPLDWGLTATFRDVNNDSAPDLYVCNDYWTADRFWINTGHGQFRAIPTLALRHISASSMSVDFSDIDRNGDLDFFVVDMLSRFPHLRKRQMLAQTPKATPPGLIDDRPQIVQNTLFLNLGDTAFTEIAPFANLAASDWSWAPLFLDVDLDGFDDLIIGAGHFRDVQDMDTDAVVKSRQHPWTGFKSDADRQTAFTRELREHYRLYPLLQMPIGAFHNQRNLTFQETTVLWGLNHPGVHQGLVTADFDRDGDLDLAVNSLNSPASLFRNESPTNRLALTLKSYPPNTQAVGSKVVLRNGAAPNLSTEIICGGRYQSSTDTEVVFATGPTTTGLVLQIQWRNGAHTILSNILANRRYEITQTRPASVNADPPEHPSRPQPELPQPIFEDASRLIAHAHHEIEFNDFERQPLLPFKLSQLGPGVAWADLNEDGHDDLVIGAGREGMPTLFSSDGHGAFWPVPPRLGFALPNDSAGFVAWHPPNRPLTLLAALTGYETKTNLPLLHLQLENQSLAAVPVSTPEITGAGALALADLTGTGSWTLFAAGGVLPGQYPIGTPSKIYRFDGRNWLFDSRQSVLLDNLGIVNSALWSDLNNDGFPELVLACEWGAIRIFRNDRGTLAPWNLPILLPPNLTDPNQAALPPTLDQLTGWWRGIASADLNNDGRLDLIASNWGLNSPYRASLEKPLIFFYGQIAQPGVTEIIETEYMPASPKPASNPPAAAQLAPRRPFMPLANAMPFLFDRIASHKDFSESSLDRLLADRLRLTRRVSAVCLASTAFLNTERGLVVINLPQSAQFSPAFGVAIADFNGDGNEDVFLSQNFFALQPETPRIDAGAGLCLLGNGAGQLTPASPAQSGLRIYGEQRGAAVADFNEDGRPDLVVAQNSAATKLFRNAYATPGLRIKIRGPAHNPHAVGAVLQLQFARHNGPAREIHAGAGYWSQDSFTQVLATPSPPKSLTIRWPGGRTTSTPVPPHAKELTIDANGIILSNR